MKIYLIDFENIKSKGLTGVQKLTEKDRVYVFYTKKDNKISIDTLDEIVNTKAKINWVEVNVGGKNALDFQLSTFLGSLVARYHNAKFFIISKDSGFDYVINFWESQNNKIDIKRVLCIKEEKAEKVIKIVKKVSNKTVDEKKKIDEVKDNKHTINDEDIIKLIPYSTEKDWLEDVKNFVNNSNGRAELYHSIRSRLGQEEGLAVYHILKKFI